MQKQRQSTIELTHGCRLSWLRKISQSNGRRADERGAVVATPANYGRVSAPDDKKAGTAYTASKRLAFIAAIVSLLTLLLAPALDAQNYGTRLGTVKRGGKVSFEPSGPGVLFDALDPTVRKWFVPQ
ncbi:MAG: hypothetical protein ACI906_004486, partial [Candidatus Latescibacterota bacterium]